ncbi:pur operon repressor [Fictibacillus enclensis]|uniref:pur operon repressor n=1 Tax=Fictibacillus enclensis TaxID=1017270 RepID=UPI0024BF2512|nr:pur operon repressor [Fictibacillus enclensis]MDM5196827.1 pur operon repressor [Fictibacillus enclensis]MDM5335955.1 pur operon repressor [Fictibacillus enclensis]WHY72452.1 pur operon repressor [Fictibacillus enclensis]
MKLKRSGRMVDLTTYLLQHPHQLIPLSYFVERYQSAKSSISEDLAIIKENFEYQGIGSIITVAGAAGGVKYIPSISKEEASGIIHEIIDMLEDPERLLPGGYLYLTDIIGNPNLVNQVGRLFSSVFSHQKIDAVMTVATKGIPLAYAVASQLNVPVVIVRSNSRVTEGSTVSINYVSGSTKRIQTMALARRSIQKGANVLIIDDFMKAGGTIRGMISLIKEFQAEVAGIGVLVEAQDGAERLVDDYVSLTRLASVNEKEQRIEVEEGNYFNQKETNEQ